MEPKAEKPSPRTSRPRKALFWAVYSAFLALLAVGMLEAAGRRIFADRLYMVDDVDHRMQPYSAPDLNGDGIRSFRESSEFTADGFNIVFLGDSFVYGTLLESEESMPAQLEALAHEWSGTDEVRVANFGWVSSSPLLALRLLREIGERYEPDLVVLGVDMTDFHDDIKYRALLERKGPYRLLDLTPVTFIALRKVVSVIPPLHGLHDAVFGFPARRFFVSDRPIEASEPHLSDFEANVDRLQAFAAQALGARFAVVVFPRTYQYSSEEVPENWEADEYELLGEHSLAIFDYVDRFAAARDYPVFSLLDEFQETDVFPTAFPHDPHWTVAGARVAAQGVFDRCVKAVLLAAGSGPDDGSPGARNAC